MLMHPRADFLRHYAVPRLLDARYAVLTQNSRSVGNDSMLVHEHVLLDVAAGVRRLRALGFERVVAIGNSGGGSLYAYYAAQAAAGAGARSTDTAAGDAFDLNRFDMPAFDAIVFLGAHPGEGLFLSHAIDPSVTNESDPIACDPSLDMYDPANGFRPPPEPTRYDDTFLARYRAAQRERVERIDELARTMIAGRRSARERVKRNPDDATEIRRATAVTFFTVYRTEADPRYVDLALDPSERDYGSLFGRRPDVINYGPFGFARVVTPEAWLSTWSALSSRASIPANGPRITLPAFVVSYTADNAVFPSDTRAIHDALASSDKTALEVRGDHYGHPLAGTKEWGRDSAVHAIVDWMRARGF
jgi:pimeloyl-ACP methyl ester carboxylesterase